jgi:sirohydrochlorin cobaltochelatase
MTALILFVHGARDPRWAVPFERLRDLITARSPDIPVRIAFLEHGTPDLSQAAIDVAAAGVRRIKVVPLFFGRGGHLREDFPRHLAAAKARVPGSGVRRDGRGRRGRRRARRTGDVRARGAGDESLVQPNTK